MNTTRKKQEEIRHISNLLDAIRCEFGGIVRLDEEERPDFIVTLPDGTKIGIEETMCCPSASQDGSPRFKYYNWKEKVRKAFFQNEYLIEKSQDKRLHINIRETPKICKGKHSVKECCEEIEKHLRNALEPTINPIPVPNLILFVKAHYIDSACNIINFSHAARRDPIKAKELIVSIKHKEQKRKEYNHDNIWLCIFLPFPENRHPHEIVYDDECTKEEFEWFIKKCGYKRIYITSEFDGIDIKRVK